MLQPIANFGIGTLGHPEEKALRTPLAAIAILIALSAPLAAQDNPPTLSANGEGAENAAPDIAIVSLGVLSRADTARAALDANNAEMQEVIQTIRGEAIADKDIATSGFSISPVFDQNQRPLPDGSMTPPKIVGYQVSNEVRVVVRDLDKTGSVLDKAVTAGANQAASISFDIEDRRALVDKAIEAAIADAKRKADLMAEAAGVRLVRVLNVNANEGGGFVRREMMAMAPKDAAVPVMGGELAISANASITWEIAPK
jgi:uncharacterized protein YggE